LGPTDKTKRQNQAKGKAMTVSKMQKFLVLYLVPASVMADWAKTDPATRQVEEQKMMAAWGKWMGEHAKMIVSADAGGKTKRVTASGVADTKNDIRASCKTIPQPSPLSA